MAVASDITLPVFGCRRAEVYVSLGACQRADSSEPALAVSVMRD
jgi:hypothetical protein